MPFTRRDILRFAGAATAGLVFSPLPWKILDDVAIWTQTGPWIAKLPRGPISHVPTVCSVCPAGCPVTARCVAGVPSALRATAGSGQPLCPIGLTGHHLAYHPLRVAGPCLVERHGDRVTTIPASLEDALGRLPGQGAGSAPGRTVMIVDQRPGRAISDRYRAFLHQRGGGYYAVPDDDASVRPVGYDLERARTILAVSSPVLDGWTTPARTARLVDRRVKNDGLRIIAAEAARSRTAMLADRWLPIRPGSEAALLASLLNLANAHRRSDLAPELREIIQRSTPEAVAPAVGQTPAHLQHLFAKLTERSPALVIVGSDGCGPVDPGTHHLAVLLNRMLGAASNGTLLNRPAMPISEGLQERDLAPVAPLSSVPDGSVDLVILDGDEGMCHVSWEAIARTLRPSGSLVVSLSPVLTALASHADMILPSPAPYEFMGEATGDPTEPSRRYALSRPLHPLRTDSVDALSVLAYLSGQPMTRDDALRAKVAGIWASRRGQVRTSDGSVNTVRSFDSANSLWSALAEGATWSLEGTSLAPPVHAQTVDSATSDGIAKHIATLLDPASSSGVTVIATTWALVTSCSRLSPLMTKLYQESGLRPTSEVAALAQQTADAFGLAEGSSAELRTGEASSTVKVRISDSLAPGTVQLSAGPDPVGLRSSAPPCVATAFPGRHAAELRKS